MSIQRIHLWRLLCFLHAPAAQQRALLLRDINDEKRRLEREGSEGGDFYLPFWADAKLHATGTIDLSEKTVVRISANYRRKRLYQLLAAAFLRWWGDVRRWSNQPLVVLPTSHRGSYEIDGVGTIKLEGLLCLKIGEGRHLIVYPYFSEEPALDQSVARLGLAVLIAGLPRFRPEDFHLLDVLRAKSWSLSNVDLQGDELANLRTRYVELSAEREKLKAERIKKIAS